MNLPLAMFLLSSYSKEMDIPGVYFHLYNKGVENRVIFNDNDDYEEFLKQIREYVATPKDRGSLKTTFEINGHSYKGVPHLPKNYYGLVELIAYNLNPRHFHLILKENVPGAIGKFMRSLCTRYAIYFNHKYSHEGGIFQGTYTSRVIEDMARLKSLTYYLHHRGERMSLEAYIVDQLVPEIDVESVLKAFDTNRREYADYINAKALQQEEADSLQSVLIPCLIDHLAQKNLTRGDIPRGVQTQGNTHRFAFFSLALAGFLFLSGLGARNIIVKRQIAITTPFASKLQPTPFTPTIEPELVEKTVDPTVLSATNSITDVPLRVQVKITQPHARVNIRLNPDPSAPIIAKAYDGDIFETTETVSNWHAIKLPDGTIGYIISSNVVVIE